MRVLSASELLGVWERGLTQSPVHRALGLLSAANQEQLPTQLAELSIGRRDGLLLTLREWTFGSQIQSVATCPHCSDQLELSFEISDIRVPVIETAQPQISLFSRWFQPKQHLKSQSSVVKFADYEIQFQLPNSLDLAACLDRVPALNPGSDNTTSPQRILLERCLLMAHHRGKQQSIDTLPPEVIEAVITQMAEEDPQANVQLNLTCPSCSHQWRSHFDIVSFFWTEIHAWAIRTLREIHTIAAAYGWSEAEILAMNPYRRYLYLEMVGR
jgi:hypothetical protein